MTGPTPAPRSRWRARRPRSGARCDRHRRRTPACASSPACAGAAASTSTVSCTRPGRRANTSTRSDRNTASSIWWVTNSTVLRPCSQMRSSSVCMISRVCASSAENGSSISRMSGIDRERAREVDALAHAAGELARIVVLEALEADQLQAGRACAAARPRRRGRRPPGRSWRCRARCATAAGCRSGTRSRGRRPAGSPACRRSATRPAVAVSSPATMRRNVVLPQPLGPTSEMNSPGADREVDGAQRFERRRSACREPRRRAWRSLRPCAFNPASTARACARASRTPPSWRCRRPPARSRRRTAPAC